MQKKKKLLQEIHDLFCGIVYICFYYLFMCLNLFMVKISKYLIDIL